MKKLGSQVSSDMYYRIKSLVKDLGYQESLTLEDYEFADPLGDEYRTRRIPLAAFAQRPPSYKSACIGLVISNGKSGPSHIADYRALGAPLIFEIAEGKLVRYKLDREANPKEVESVSDRDITELFSRNRADWKPDSILRAKALGRRDGVVQLDFVDAGLMPAIEGMIQSKIDKLLRNLLYDAVTEIQGEVRGPDEIVPTLFRLVFRLLAAKILHDRQHPGPWGDQNSSDVLRSIDDYYGFEDYETLMTVPQETIQSIWDTLRSSFFFHNLSVDDLAYVYENTLITDKTRKIYGVHSTPPSLAEYIVANLPFESVDVNSRYVLEPFAGHAIFLIAAMRRLRDSLPTSWSNKKIHNYLVRRLVGIEKDDFAREVARLSLMLADYPNSDGWRLIGDDVFLMREFRDYVDEAEIVLCNPPFEDFTAEEKKAYQSQIQFSQKPAEILHRIIANPPALLGFVMPRTFLHGDRYRFLRHQLAQKYAEIELVALPGGIFHHSDAESSIVLAHDRMLKSPPSIQVVTKWVDEGGKDEFARTGRATRKTITQVRPSSQEEYVELWQDPLTSLWAHLETRPTLGEFIEIHRGIEWSIPLTEPGNREKLISRVPREGFAKGLETSRDKLEQYVANDPVYLNTSMELARGGALKYRWNDHKVIANAATSGRGPWRLVAAPDFEGWTCYQRLHGIWPRTDIALEIIAAILNGPVANAFMYFNEGRRDNRITTIKQIPVPDLSRIQDRQDIINLVHEYRDFVGDHRREGYVSSPTSASGESYLARLLMKIDALVLQAYNLPPKFEKQVLDIFLGYSRPVPFRFDQFLPSRLEAYVRLSEYLEPGFERASASSTIKRIKPVSDPAIHKIIEDLGAST